MSLEHQSELGNVLVGRKNNCSEVISKLFCVECNVMIRKKKVRTINEKNSGPQTCNVNNQSSQRECLKISDISDDADDDKMK